MAEETNSSKTSKTGKALLIWYIWGIAWGALLFFSSWGAGAVYGIYLESTVLRELGIVAFSDEYWRYIDEKPNSLNLMRWGIPLSLFSLVLIYKATQKKGMDFFAQCLVGVIIFFVLFVIFLYWFTD